MPGAGMRTPGPIFHFVQLAGQTGYYFWGTSKTAPSIEQQKFEIPVMNDLSGRSVRFQSVQDGAEWKVFTLMNRFDLNVTRSLRYLFSGNAFPNPLTGPPLGTALNSLGSENVNARGTLVIGQSDFQLVLMNTYAGTTAAGLPAAAAADLNSIRGFYSCSLTGYSETTEGERVLDINCAIECRNTFNPLTTTFANYFEGAASIITIPNPGGFN